MTTLIKKVKGRKTYYYAVRSGRVDGKPRIVWQKYLGTLDAILEQFEKNSAPKPIETTLFEAGGVAALMNIASRVNLMDIINQVVPKRNQGPSVGHYIVLAALNRVLDPMSKSQIGDWYQNTILRRLWGFHEDHFTSQRFWDHMGMISQMDLDNIQRLVTEKVKSEFKIETDSLLYDCTNFFTYIDTHNERSALAKRGKNKQKRMDLQQINLALLTTKEFQIPLFHRAYKGNIPDVKIFPEIARSLLDKNKALSGNVKDSTLIFDKGNLSEENRELLLHSGIYFVAGVRNDLISDLFETPIEKFQEAFLMPGTKYFSSPIEISGSNCMAVISYSESFFTEQLTVLTLSMRRCEEKLREMQKNLADYALGKKKNCPRPKTTAVKANLKSILASQHMERIFTVDLQVFQGVPILKYSVNQKEFERTIATRLGRTLLITNRIKWLPEEVIGAYRSLSNVEEAFKYMKNRDYLRWQPAYHWTDQKVEVHTLYCVLALLLATLARKIAVENGLVISLPTLLDDLSGIKEVALLYQSDKKGVEARFTVNSMTARQKKLADLFKIGEVLVEG
jgi:transposase